MGPVTMKVLKRVGRLGVGIQWPLRRFWKGGHNLVCLSSDSNLWVCSIRSSIQYRNSYTLLIILAGFIDNRVDR